MNYGEYIYPELHDPEWLSTFGPLGPAAVAEELGCSNTHASRELRRNGFSTAPCEWTPPETDVLVEFYAGYGSPAIASVIPRTRGAIYAKAHREGIHGNYCKEKQYDEVEFLAEYQGFLLEHIDEWLPEYIDTVSRFVWYPRIITQDACDETCKFFPSCKTIEHPPCQDILVGDSAMF